MALMRASRWMQVTGTPPRQLGTRTGVAPCETRSTERLLATRAYCTTTEPRYMLIPHVNATLPDAGIVMSTSMGWFSGRSFRMPRVGKTTCCPHPSSVVRVKTKRTGFPAGEWTLSG